MDDEYSTDISSLQQTPQMPQMQSQQQMPQMQSSNPMYNYPPNFQPGQSPGYITDCSKPPPSVFEPKANLFSFGSQIEHFSTKENIQSVIIIIILFMILASGFFKKLVYPVSFIKISENGEYSILSLFILGLSFAILFMILKLLL